VLKQVDHPKLVACDTMNFWITGKLASLKRVLRHVDVLCSTTRRRAAVGEHSLLKAAGRSPAGPGRVVVKRGDAGALLFDEAGILWAPAYPWTTSSTLPARVTPSPAASSRSWRMAMTCGRPTCVAR